MHRRSRTARRFIFAAILMTSVSVAGGVLLLRFGRSPHADEFRIPPLFWGSTVALLTGSVALHRAVYFVSIERQRAFRGHLLAGLAAGTLFVAFQIAGMGYLLQMRENLAGAPIEATVTVGARPYVFVAAALHAMHFVVAMLALTYVVVNGFDDRYDHEAYFPVRFCAWFWHTLGVFWVAIMYVCSLVFS